LFRFLAIVVALTATSIAAPVRAAEPLDPVTSPLPPTFPREGLVLENPGRGERSSISSDPVAARVVAGTWTTPGKNESITFKKRTGPPLASRAGNP
jgi:hypothetical protein